MNHLRQATTAATPEDLLLRYRETGEPGALGALFDATAPELFRVALALAPDAAAAEDALQETYLTALESAGRWDGSRPVVPWLAGILRIELLRARRREARVPDPARLDPPILPEDPADAVARDEATERVRAALEALPEPYRSVGLLRWRYGLEPGEIAELRKEPPGTIRSLLHRAAQRLRRTLGSLAVIVVGPRVPKGYEAVRDEVLAHARWRVAAAVGVTTAAGAGGVLMGKKAVAAVVLLVLLVSGTWVAFGPGGGEAGDPGRAPSGSPSTAAESPDTTSHRPGTAGTSPGESVRDARPAPEPPSGTSSLRGRVVDGNSAAVGGAQVALEDLRLTEGGPRTHAALRTTSSTDGGFRFDDLEPGRYGLVVLARGFSDLRDRPVVLPREEPLDVVLDEEGVLAGTVVDAETGAPVKAFLVHLEARGWGDPKRPRGHVTRKEQREGLPIDSTDGAFRLAGRVLGATYALRVVGADGSRGYGEADAVGASRADPGSLVLRLYREGKMVGRVLDAATGRGIPGATVWSLGFTPLAERPPASRSVGESDKHDPARTSSDGTFALEAPSRSWYELLVEAEGYAPLRISGLPNPRSLAVVGLERPAAVRGTVEYIIPGSRVRVASGGIVLAAVSPDEAGRFRIQGLSPGLAEVILEHGDAAVLSRTVSLRAGEEAEVLLGAGKGLAVDGLVRRGRVPAAGERVAFDGEFGRIATVRTDSAGLFRLAGLPAGAIVVSVGEPSPLPPWRAPTRVRLALGPSDARVDIDLAPSGEVSGVFVDAEGRPVGGTAMIALQEVLPGQAEDLLGRLVGSFEQRGYCTTDARGAFRVSNLPPGRYVVRSAPYQTSSEAFDLREGEVKSGITVVKEAIGGTSVEVEVVLEESGAPAAEIRVSLDRDDGAGTEVGITDIAGIFRSRPLPQGTYRVGAFTPTRPTAAMEVRVGKEPCSVRLTLRSAGTVRFRLAGGIRTVPGETPVLRLSRPEGFTGHQVDGVYAIDPVSSMSLRLLEADGTEGVLGSLPAGPVKVHAVLFLRPGESALERELAFTVAAGQETLVELFRE